jgi:streptogrisin C
LYGKGTGHAHVRQVPCIAPPAARAGAGASDPGSVRHEAPPAPWRRCLSLRHPEGGQPLVQVTHLRDGDSGGPLFSEIDSKAYGILTDGSTVSGACPSNPPGTEYSRYTPISNVFSMAHQQTGYYFNVRTSG